MRHLKQIWIAYHAPGMTAFKHPFFGCQPCFSFVTIKAQAWRLKIHKHAHSKGLSACKERMLAYLLAGILRMLGKMHGCLEGRRGDWACKDGFLKRMLKNGDCHGGKAPPRKDKRGGLAMTT